MAVSDALVCVGQWCVALYDIWWRGRCNSVRGVDWSGVLDEGMGG